jgi:hypothetical protein
MRLMQASCDGHTTHTHTTHTASMSPVTAVSAVHTLHYCFVEWSCAVDKDYMVHELELEAFYGT